MPVLRRFTEACMARIGLWLKGVPISADHGSPRGRWNRYWGCAGTDANQSDEEGHFASYPWLQMGEGLSLFDGATAKNCCR